jgi:hypothetical protein
MAAKGFFHFHLLSACFTRQGKLKFEKVFNKIEKNIKIDQLKYQLSGYQVKIYLIFITDILNPHGQDVWSYYLFHIIVFQVRHSCRQHSSKEYDRGRAKGFH